jgi:uncharacterized protein (DUF1501 family)
MEVTRRAFLKTGGIAMLGITALPTFLRRAVAATLAPSKRILIVLFQRGAVDGLNVVAPFGEPNYYRIRPTIAIPQPSRGQQNAAIDLNGFFGLHPSLAPLEPLYRQGQLAVVHATGSPDPSRSHFDAQDYMEAGTPGVKSTDDGWLNRALVAAPEPKPSPFRAIATDPTLPLTLRGRAPALALSNLRQFRLYGPEMVETSFEAMYDDARDPLLRSTGRETFEAVDALKKIDPENYQPENGAQYPRSRFGQGLQEIAQLIKEDVGLEVAFLDSGGWDHHVNEGSTEGRLANLLRDLAGGLAAFARDMGGRMEHIVFVSMSEFGRTAHENGNRGTDHGHGNYMFVMGGPVKGGKVYTRWPGLAPEQLNDNRDLKVTTDYRAVLSELLVRHVGCRDLRRVFPNFDSSPRAYLNLLKV